MSKGFVYILVSPNSNYIKIGGAEKPITERIRSINGSTPYGDHGPWQLSDFLHVTDWRSIEANLHQYSFAKESAMLMAHVNSLACQLMRREDS